MLCLRVFKHKENLLLTLVLVALLATIAVTLTPTVKAGGDADLRNALDPIRNEYVKFVEAVNRGMASASWIPPGSSVSVSNIVPTTFAVETCYKRYEIVPALTFTVGVYPKKDKPYGYMIYAYSTPSGEIKFHEQWWREGTSSGGRGGYGGGGYYSPPRYTLTVSVSPSGSGTTNPSPGSYTYDSGTSVTVTATPKLGYRFKQWLLDGSNAGSSLSITVTMNRDHSLTAVFEAVSVDQVLSNVRLSVAPPSDPSAFVDVQGLKVLPNEHVKVKANLNLEEAWLSGLTAEVSVSDSSGRLKLCQGEQSVKSYACNSRSLGVESSAFYLEPVNPDLAWREALHGLGSIQPRSASSVCYQTGLTVTITLKRGNERYTFTKQLNVKVSPANVASSASYSADVATVSFRMLWLDDSTPITDRAGRIGVVVKGISGGADQSVKADGNGLASLTLDLKALRDGPIERSYELIPCFQPFTVILDSPHPQLKYYDLVTSVERKDSRIVRLLIAKYSNWQPVANARVQLLRDNPNNPDQYEAYKNKDYVVVSEAYTDASGHVTFNLPSDYRVLDVRVIPPSDPLTVYSPLRYANYILLEYKT